MFFLFIKWKGYSKNWLRAKQEFIIFFIPKCVTIYICPEPRHVCLVSQSVTVRYLYYLHSLNFQARVQPGRLSSLEWTADTIKHVQCVDSLHLFILSFNQLSQTVYDHNQMTSFFFFNKVAMSPVFAKKKRESEKQCGLLNLLKLKILRWSSSLIKIGYNILIWFIFVRESGSDV